MRLTRWRDQSGLVGKAAVFWLLLVAVLGVAAVDTVSIALTTFKLSDVATEAASDAAAAFRSQHDVAEACDVASASVEAQAPALNMGRNGCKVDPPTGRVTITLKAVANTVLAHRFGPTEEYVEVLVSETNGPSNV
ncbi:MAG: hypothetical protein ABWZ53_00955 [Actinomycetota bacterium]